jgi:streptomycin 6-kinase
VIYLPEKFIETIKSVHREHGQKWLDNFNDLVKYCEERWRIQIQAPYELSYNFVAPAFTVDGSQVVIKLVVLGDGGFEKEIEALKLFNGNGIARLLDYETEKGIMILEMVLPGEKLSLLSNDEESTIIISQVMKNLWTNAPTNSCIPTIFQREDDFKQIRKEHKNGIGPLSKQMLIEAEEIFSRLTSTIKDLYLLHGDFHHYNILSAKNNTWVAIDPKGLIGEREYDVIQFLLNKLPDDKIADVIDRRIDILVGQLELNKERVLLWGFCHSILSLYWHIEDFGVPDETTLKVITAFKKLHNELSLRTLEF